MHTSNRFAGNRVYLCSRKQSISVRYLKKKHVRFFLSNKQQNNVENRSNFDSHVTAHAISSPVDQNLSSANQSVTTDEWQDEIDELIKLTDLLPADVRARLEENPDLYQLLEVVMDLGRPPVARFPTGDVRLSHVPVTAEDLQEAIMQIGEFGGDNRAGIDRTLHRISCIRNRSGKIIGLTCRAGRSILGSGEMVRDLALSGSSLLLLGPPGVGKTTAIREISRMLADEMHKRVVIVDTSNEIGGDGDIPHPGIGRARRMQVPVPEEQHQVMIEAVENHMPEVIVIDEIGTEAECVAARTIAQRGVQLVATAHGTELTNVVKNPSLVELIGGIQSVTLGDEEAKRRGVQKTILERAGPPTFDVAIEMIERNKWRIHLEVGKAVDILLLGGEPGGQMREKASDGSLLKLSLAHKMPPAPGGNGRVRAAGGFGSGSGASSRSVEGSVLGDEEAGRRGTSTSRRSLFSKKSERDVESDTEAMFSSQDEEPQVGTFPNQRVSPEAADLRLYCHELDMDLVWEVLGALGLRESVYLARSLEEADAVLALRPRLRGSTNAELRVAAHAAHKPIYAIKNSGAPNLVKAFRTLLCIDPSAGDRFGQLRKPEEVSAAQSSLDGSMDEPDASPSSAASEKEALEEVQVAAEQIVVPLNQPVELLPRSEAVRILQLEMLARYRLVYEVIGEGKDTRIRVLPSSKSTETEENGNGHGNGNGNGVKAAESVAVSANSVADS